MSHLPPTSLCNNCLIQMSKEVTDKSPSNSSPKILKTFHSKQLLITVGLSKGATKKPSTPLPNHVSEQIGK